MSDRAHTLVAGKRSNIRRAAMKGAISRDADKAKEKGRSVTLPRLAFVKRGDEE